MDGAIILAALRDGGCLADDRPVPRPTRPSRFLQRDLSEHALRLPPEPTFTKAELSAAGQDAFAAGRAAGLAEAAASRAAAEAGALATIADGLLGGAAEAGRVADQAAEALARTLIAAMHAVVPDLIERSALRETAAMLAQLLPGLSREPRVQVSVPPGLAPGIEAALDSLAPELRDRIAVTGSPGLGQGEAKIEWEAGHALRRPGQVWQAVMRALEPIQDKPQTKDQQNGG